MFAIILSLLCSIRQGFRTRAAIQTEIVALRHQLLVLQRSARSHKVRLTASDRFLWLSRLWSEWRSALLIVKPETVIAWHRRGFRLYWSWKSRHPQGPYGSHFSASIVRRATNQPAIRNRSTYVKWKEILVMPAQRFRQVLDYVSFLSIRYVNLITFPDELSKTRFTRRFLTRSLETITVED